MKTATQHAEAKPRGKAPRALLLGGFLGAGKTTLLIRLAKHLANAGAKPGLITNGQRPGLVDTVVYQFEGYETIEVAGGCVCTRPKLLAEAAAQLVRKGVDSVLVEGWGTCASFGQAVSALREDFLLGPTTVVADAGRAFGGAVNPGFSPAVKALVQKQVREAELLLLNKVDLAPSVDPVLQEMRKVNANAKILPVSGRRGDGLEGWFPVAFSQVKHRPTLSPEGVGPGQALLGGVHARVQLSSVRYFDATKVLRALAGYVQDELLAGELPLAHLNMMINAEEDLGEVATINLAGGGGTPEILRRVSEPLEHGELLINLSAEGDSETLANRLNGALHDLMEEHPNLFARLEEAEHFSAAKAHALETARP